MSSDQLDPAERFPRRTLRRQNTRKRIILAATRLFQRVGYGSATMNAIAEAADVHVTTLFTHFKSKQDLAASANDATIERLEKHIERTGGKVPFFTFFRDMVMDVAGRLEREDPSVTVWSELERDPDLALAWATYEHRQVVMLSAYVAAEYDLSPDDYSATLVASLMVSASWEAHRRWTTDNELYDLKQETLTAIATAETMARAVLKPRA